MTVANQGHFLVERGGSIIASMGEGGARIFDVRKTEDGFEFSEACDGYYYATLNADQLRRLIAELEALLKS